MSVVRVVSEVKEGSKGSQIFHFNNSEIKQCSECSEVKYGHGHSQRNYFNSSDSKNTVVNIVRHIILVVVK